MKGLFFTLFKAVELSAVVFVPYYIAIFAEYVFDVYPSGLLPDWLSR